MTFFKGTLGISAAWDRALTPDELARAEAAIMLSRHPSRLTEAVKIIADMGGRIVSLGDSAQTGDPRMTGTTTAPKPTAGSRLIAAAKEAQVLARTARIEAVEARAQAAEARADAMAAQADEAYARGMSDGQAMLRGTRRLVVIDSPEVAGLRARAAMADALAELVSVILETPSEFETEWDVDARTTLAAYRAAQEGR